MREEMGKGLLSIWHTGGRLRLEKDYPEPFCDQVTQNLNTDFTARRMTGYIMQTPKARLEDIADEMLAILSDRAVIMHR